MIRIREHGGSVNSPNQFATGFRRAGNGRVPSFKFSYCSEDDREETFAGDENEDDFEFGDEIGDDFFVYDNTISKEVHKEREKKTVSNFVGKSVWRKNSGKKVAGKFKPAFLDVIEERSVELGSSIAQPEDQDACSVELNWRASSSIER